DCIVKYLPTFMKSHCYYGLCVLSDSQKILDNIRGRIGLALYTEIVSEDYLNTIERVENSLGCFKRIYSDISIPMEDGDFYQLIGYDNITLDDIVARVIFQLDHIPSDSEILAAKNWVEETKKINTISTRIVSLTNHRVTSVDKCVVLKQRKEIEKIVSVRKKNIYLYANTNVARMCLDVYGDCNILGVIDRNAASEEAVSEGVSLFGLEQLEKIDFEKDIILVTNRRCEEVAYELEKRGGKLNQNIFLLNLKPDINDWEDEELLDYIEKEFKKGERIYNSLRKKYPREKFLLSPWKASGDIYVAGLYFKEYIERNCKGGYRIFVTSPAAKKVASIMGYDSEVISQDDMNDMLVYIRYRGFETTNSLNINVNYPIKDKPQRLGLLLRVLDFNTAHQRVVFGSEVKKTRIELLQKNSDELFEQYGLQKGNTILLAPYSNTLGNIPKEAAADMARRLKQMGYSVCTNIAGDEEAIEGTTGLFLPYDIVLDFVNKAGGIIGIRSGLFDIVSSTDAKMAVYYQKSHQSLFSLIHMDLKTKNIIEMNPDDQSWNEIVEETLRFF
ncbi:MAG: hypothetical protein K5675_11305, partial [Lachnospiraceae bacterium]|nr:hypothetical protein [Lachnospiraceae bacterium]